MEPFFRFERAENVRGDGSYWEHPVCGVRLPQDLIDFATGVMKEYGQHLRLRK